MSATELVSWLPAIRRSGEVDADAQQRGDHMRGRIRLAVGVFGLAYLAIIARLVFFGIAGPGAATGGYDANAALATGRCQLRAPLAPPPRRPSCSGHRRAS